MNTGHNKTRATDRAACPQNIIEPAASFTETRLGSLSTRWRDGRIDADA